MGPHYRHTQIGWVILAALIALAALVWSQTSPTTPFPAAASVALLLVAAVLLLFATLTVEVDSVEIRVSFSGALIRRRIALADVVELRPVRNHWLSGWGIRLVPGGWLWNVSGLDAVELLLRSGRVFRIGTDEPDDLLKAIRQVAPRAGPPATGGTATHAARAGSSRRQAILPVAVLVVVAALVLALWLSQTRPPAVSVTPQRITVQSLFYGDSYPMDDVVDVSLEEDLPRILARTNGFAGGASLRGWFDLEGLGAGKLFVERGASPYLVLRLRRGFVIVSFRQREKTLALFAELQRSRPGQVRPSGAAGQPR